MKTLAKQISTLLFEHDCVIVPGLGAFIAIYKPAIINPNNHTFYPPSKQIIFNAALTQNDGILINAYAASQGIDFSQAGIAVNETVQNIRISLLKGKKIELTEIGHLITNKENNIEFSPAGIINFLGDAYGLTRFSFNPVDRSSSTSRVLGRPAVRKSMRWAAVLLPLAALAMWTTFNAGSLNKIYNNYASLAPSAKQEVTSIKTEKATPVKNTSTLSISEQDVNEVTEDSRCISPAIVESTYSFSRPEALSTSGITKTLETDLTVKKAEPHVRVNDAPGTGIQYYIIAGAFGVEENALKLINQLKSEGYSAEILGQNRRKLHLVSIKSFGNKEIALKELQAIHHNGYSYAWLLEKAN